MVDSFDELSEMEIRSKKVVSCLPLSCVDKDRNADADKNAWA